MIYELKHINLNSGHRPGAHWVEEEKVIQQPILNPPTWRPGDPLEEKPNWTIKPEPAISIPPDLDEGRGWPDPAGSGWVYWLGGGGWQYEGPPHADAGHWHWNFNSRVWEYTGEVRPSEYGDWVWDGNSWKYTGQITTETILEPVLRDILIPDQLIVYIYVHKKGEKDEIIPKWEDINSTTKINNDITEIGTLCTGFDEDEYEFKSEDITFKVYDESGIYEREILNPELVSEIRILHAQPIKTAWNEPIEYQEAKPLFYGIIDKGSIHFSDEVKYKDGNYTKNREYEFTCLNYFTQLKEYSIEELREAIQADIPLDYVRNKLDKNIVLSDEHGWTDWIIDNITNKKNIVTKADVYFITIERLFKNIFFLIFPDMDSFAVKSDIDFWYYNTKNWDVPDYFPQVPQDKLWRLDSSKDKDDNVCIYFYIDLWVYHTDHKKTVKHDVYTYSLFDRDTSRSPWSFYKHQNILSLLNELLINFGLVWRASYEILDSKDIYKWNINFELVTRFNGIDRGTLYDDIHKDIEGTIVAKQFDGAVVSVSGYGDVSNYKYPEPTTKIESPVAILWNKYVTPSDKMKNLTTSFLSWIGHINKGGYYHHDALKIQQCLFGYSNDRLVPINRYRTHFGSNGNIIEEYPKYYKQPYMNQESDYDDDNMDAINSIELFADHNYYRQFFAEMVANYYAGEHGIYTKFVRNSMSLKIDLIDVDPLDVITLDAKKYIVLRTEKYFVDGSSKLELKEY